MSDAPPWETYPDPTRPTVPLSQAKAVFGRHLRTLQNSIRAGELAGGKYPGKPRWYVYTDTDVYAAATGVPRHPRPGEPAPANDAIDDLRHQLTLRDAQLRDRDDTIRQLTAAAALEAERATAHEQVADHLLKALTASRLEAQKSVEISAIYRDLVAGHYIPDDPSQLA